MDGIQVLASITGILISGEAIFLLIKRLLFDPRPNKWNTMRNTNTLFIDMAFGALLVIHAIEPNPFIQLSVFALLATHAYREFEYLFRKSEIMFIINTPLFVVNTINLSLLVLLAILVL
jgi:hypothetical protein